MTMRSIVHEPRSGEAIFINRLPQSRLTTVKRVRACESGQSVIETRFLLFSNAKRDDIVLDECIFPTKVQKICIWSFYIILYEMLPE